MVDYITIDSPASSTIEIKKSVFICSLFPVFSEEDARRHLLDVKKEHFKATHNCYAYIVGEDVPIKRFSDDNEPNSTAGRPILSVLEKNSLSNILAVVTRYFGGIKLGAGGLVRAYSESAASSLANAKMVRYTACVLFNIEFSYNQCDKVTSFLTANELKITESNYSENVKFTFLCEKSLADKIRDDYINLTQGTGNIEVIGEKYKKILVL